MFKSYSVTFALLFCLSGCQQRSESQPSVQHPKTVVCTTGMVADVARRLLGSDSQVNCLMGPGVDPHLYKATASDVSALQNADVVFYNGLHLEGRMSEVFQALQKAGHQVVGVAEGIDKTRLRQLKPGQSYVDPHIWFDVSLWSEVIQPMTETLVQAEPSQADAIHQRAKLLKEELEKLHLWCHKELAQIPSGRRVLVTSHDAFGYFGRAYGIEVVALQGISTVSEASTSDVTKLVDYLKDRQIPAIFIESSVPKAIMERVAADAGVKIGGELFSDAMGPSGSDSGTYPGMIRYNVELIVKALQ